MFVQSFLLQYNDVFGILLELRIMSLQLRQLWQDCVQPQGKTALIPAQVEHPGLPVHRICKWDGSDCFEATLDIQSSHQS